MLLHLSTTRGTGGISLVLKRQIYPAVMVSPAHSWLVGRHNPASAPDTQQWVFGAVQVLLFLTQSNTEKFAGLLILLSELLNTTTGPVRVPAGGSVEIDCPTTKLVTVAKPDNKRPVIAVGEAPSVQK